MSDSTDNDNNDPIIVFTPNNQYGILLITPESTNKKLGYGPLAEGFICTTNPKRKTNAIRCTKSVLSYFNIDVPYDEIANIDRITNNKLSLIHI